MEKVNCDNLCNGNSPITQDDTTIEKLQNCNNIKKYLGTTEQLDEFKKNRTYANIVLKGYCANRDFGRRSNFERTGGKKRKNTKKRRNNKKKRNTKKK